MTQMMVWKAFPIINQQLINEIIKRIQNIKMAVILT